MTKTLAELREELHRIDDAIVAFERLSHSKEEKRQGRPPAWLVEARKRNARADNAADA